MINTSPGIDIVTKNSSSADEPRGPTPFQDPLEGWTNDDLLLDDKEREHFRRRHPRLASIFDWPELRQAFKVHERPAKETRKGAAATA